MTVLVVTKPILRHHSHRLSDQRYRPHQISRADAVAIVRPDWTALEPCSGIGLLMGGAPPLDFSIPDTQTHWTRATGDHGLGLRAWVGGAAPRGDRRVVDARHSGRHAVLTGLGVHGRTQRTDEARLWKGRA